MSDWISIAVSVMFGAATLLLTYAKLKDDEHERIRKNLTRWSATTKRIAKFLFYCVGILNSIAGVTLILVISSSIDISRKDVAGLALHVFVLLALIGELITSHIYKKLDRQEKEIQELKAQLKLWQQAPLPLDPVVKPETTAPITPVKNAASPCIESANSYQN